MSGPGGATIRFERVGVVLGGRPVLEEVDLRILPGTLHCLVGPNGAGKTTLLGALLGETPHTGVIRIEWPAHPVIGYMPQGLAFDPTLPVTVRDFLALLWQRRPAFLGASRATRPAIDEALEAVGLAGKAGRPLGRISGGEMKRLLLAQALVPEPALLVLDEPMNGLDVSGVDLFRGLLDDRRRRGTTILMVHHDLETVGRIADTVTCLDRTVRFSGPPAEALAPERRTLLFAPVGSAYPSTGDDRWKR